MKSVVINLLTMKFTFLLQQNSHLWFLQAAVNLNTKQRKSLNGGT
jgi:hypothetical protein